MLELFADLLAALGAEAQEDRAVVAAADIRFEQRGRSARLVFARIFFAAGADGGSGDQLDDRRKGEFPGQRFLAQFRGERTTDTGKHSDKIDQLLRLADIADFFPIPVIAVLQPACCVAAGRLDVGSGIGGKAHILIGWRHGKLVEPQDHPLVGDAPPAGRPVGPAFAFPPAPDGERSGLGDAQAEFPGERSRGNGRHSRFLLEHLWKTAAGGCAFPGSVPG